VIVDRLDRHVRPHGVEGDPLVVVRVQQLLRRHRGVQVVVDHPAQRGVPVGRAVVLLGELRGVRPEQVVEGEPSRCPLGDQVCPGQLGQRAADRGRRQAGQAGRGGRRDVRPGMHSEQPEQPGRRRRERLVGP
jgi:hypothetical protein